MGAALIQLRGDRFCTSKPVGRVLSGHLHFIDILYADRLQNRIREIDFDQYRNITFASRVVHRFETMSLRLVLVLLLALACVTLAVDADARSRATPPPLVAPATAGIDA